VRLLTGSEACNRKSGQDDVRHKHHDGIMLINLGVVSSIRIKSVNGDESCGMDGGDMYDVCCFGWMKLPFLVFLCF
jgi:hypothetical protein